MEPFLLNALDVVLPVATLFAIPAAAGLLPRVGPGRAMYLANRVRLFAVPRTVSMRYDELNDLHRLLTSTYRYHYVVVSGPSGVGKSCIIDSALRLTAGNVSVRVAAGATEEKILADALTAITRVYTKTLDKSGSARRVLWWHQFLYRIPVVVVLSAADRRHAEPFAALENAARVLTEDYGARVVIDASYSSMPFATGTSRELVLEVEPMARSLMEQLPELAPLHEALRESGLGDVVWACLGGNPASYLGLLTLWKMYRNPVPCQKKEDGEVGEEGGEGLKDIELAVAFFVQGLIGKALSLKSNAIAADKRLKALFLLFRDKEQGEVDFSVLDGMEIVRPSNDNVLHAKLRRSTPGQEGYGSPILVPADAAMALVLRVGFVRTPSIATLKAMVASELEGGQGCDSAGDIVGGGSSGGGGGDFAPTLEQRKPLR